MHTRHDYVRAMQLGDTMSMSFGDLEYLTSPIVSIHLMPLDEHPLVHVFHDHRSDTYRYVVIHDERLIVPDPPFKTLVEAMTVAASF